MENPKFSIVLLICGTVFGCCLVWALSWGYVYSWRAVTQAGYVQQQMQGSTQTIWVKSSEMSNK